MNNSAHNSIRSRYPGYNGQGYDNCFQMFCKKYPGHYACPGNDNCLQCWGCPYRGC